MIKRVWLPFTPYSVITIIPDSLCLNSTDKSGGSSNRDMSRGSSLLNDQDLEADIFASKEVVKHSPPEETKIKQEKEEEDDDEEEEPEDDEKLKMVSMLAERIR